jgi:hypothetical protein
MLSYGLTREYPDAMFLYVNLAARNNDRTASILPPLKLVDNKGREYEGSSKPVLSFSHSSEGEAPFSVLTSLNPGVTTHGYVVFDVPRGKYALKLSGGFRSEEYELVDLPN